MTTQPGLRFAVCLQEAGWIQARSIQQAVFLPPVYFFEKGSCKVHDEPFQPGLNNLHVFFQLVQPSFQPGLSCKRAIAFMCVESQPGLKLVM